MKCIIKNCSGDATSRGLCWKDYFVALALVRKGKTTWDFLIKNNMALERKNQNEFTKQFKSLKHE